MPELNIGSLQGTALPFYLTVKTLAGDMVDQPAESPTIQIYYIDPNSHVRRNVIAVTTMHKIEIGRYFYVWRIAKDEPIIRHNVILQAFLEKEDKINEIATDATYTISELVQQPVFLLYVDVLKYNGLCYPETLGRDPRCKKRPYITKWQKEEVDIGLDDRAIEGAFRFAEFPNAVVDRRTVGGMSVTMNVGGVSSEDPGGGPAQRSGNPATNTKYRYRDKYRY